MRRNYTACAIPFGHCLARNPINPTLLACLTDYALSGFESLHCSLPNKKDCSLAVFPVGADEGTKLRRNYTACAIPFGHCLARNPINPTLLACLTDYALSGFESLHCSLPNKKDCSLAVFPVGADEGTKLRRNYTACAIPFGHCLARNPINPTLLACLTDYALSGFESLHCSLPNKKDCSLAVFPVGADEGTRTPTVSH